MCGPLAVTEIDGIQWKTILFGNNAIGKHNPNSIMVFIVLQLFRLLLVEVKNDELDVKELNARF